MRSLEETLKPPLESCSKAQNLPLFQGCSLTLGLGCRSPKLPGVILSDVSVAPDVEMVLLGVAHRLLVTFDQLLQLAASLPLDKEQAVLDEVLAHVLLVNVDRDEGVGAGLVLHVQLDSLVQDIVAENLYSLGCKLFILR